jgi:hypothetical protein
MKLQIQNGLLYATVLLEHKGKKLSFDNVIIDTGSSGTVFSKSKVSTIGLYQEPIDPSRKVHGVGGAEFVFTKCIDSIMLDDLQVSNFNIQVGDMKYGLNIDGIIGLDFLLQTKSIIDLFKMEIYK